MLRKYRGLEYQKLPGKGYTYKGERYRSEFKAWAAMDADIAAAGGNSAEQLRAAYAAGQADAIAGREATPPADAELADHYGDAFQLYQRRRGSIERGREWRAKLERGEITAAEFMVGDYSR